LESYFPVESHAKYAKLHERLAALKCKLLSSKEKEKAVSRELEKLRVESAEKNKRL
jgi:hypothetical protein